MSFFPCLLCFIYFLNATVQFVCTVYTSFFVCVLCKINYTKIVNKNGPHVGLKKANSVYKDEMPTGIGISRVQ